MIQGKIYLTGSTGFLGKHFLERVKNKCYLYNRKDTLESVTRFNPEYIFHFAAEIYDDEKMFDSNIKLTYDLLQKARKLPNLKAFIYVGSSSEYGRKDHPMTENDFLDPQTIYEATKGACSLMCQAFARTYGLPVMVARPFSLYGKHEPKHRFIPTIINSILKRKKLKISPGVHDFIHIDDFIDGLLLLAEYPKPGEVFNFGSEVQTSNEELVKIIEDIIGKKSVKEKAPLRHPYDSGSWVCGVPKASGIGWSRKYDLYTGLKKVIEEHYVAA